MKENKKIRGGEVAKENADTARLDWFIREGARLLKSGSRGWACQFGTRVIYGNSPREAIDAARDAWNKRAPLTPLRSGLLQDALEALYFVCRIWSKPSDPTPSDVKECYEACRIVLARANAEGVSLISSASTKPTVTTTEENLVGERQPTKGDAARGD